MKNGNTPANGAAPFAAVADRSNLTTSQFLIWLGQKLTPDVPLYNMAHTFTIEGALDPALFQQAFQALIDGSDALRTVIVEEDGVPQQRVRAQLPITVAQIDLSGEPDPDAAFQYWLNQRRLHNFVLSDGLFDTVLLKLGPQRWVWYYNQHHLTVDVLSVALIFRRMSELYQQAQAGTLDAAPAQPAYADYVAHERAYRQSAQADRAQAYWQEKLAQPLEPVTFYGQTGHGAGTTTRRVPCALGPERSQALRAIAEQPGIRSFSLDLTLMNVFNALLFTYLYRVSGQRRLGIGTPFHNRATPAFRDTIGLFINIFPLQVEIEPEETFRSLITKGMGETMGGLRHAQYVLGNTINHRTFDVVLNYMTASFDDFAGLPTAFQWVHSGYGDSHHHLRVQVNDFGRTGDFTLYFDFNTDVFDRAQQKQAVDHFLRVVDAFIADPDAALDRVSLLSDADHRRFVVDFNATATDAPLDQTVVQLFEAQTARTPDAVAVTLPNAQPTTHNALTYAQLNARANQLARYLQTLGVGPETLVAVCLAHSAETIVTLLGILKAGAAYVPLDPAYPAERLDYMLTDSAAPVVITQARLEALLPPTAAHVLCIDRDWSTVAAQADGNLPPQATPDNLCYVIYTSGSTGRPKGVLLRHEGLTNYVWWATGQYTAGEPCAFPLFSSLSFDLTVTSIYVPLISGGRVVVYNDDSEEGKRLLVFRVFEDDLVDVVKLTPAHLALIRERALTPTRLTRLIVGGEDFKMELAQAIHDQFGGRVAIYNEYGPTEAVVGAMIHQFDPARDTKPSVPIGVPIDNAHIYVLDDQHQPVPPGIIGEIVIGGAGVARGYLNRPNLTADKFIPLAETPNLERPTQNPQRSTLYRTGDLARWGRDGQLEFLGRADDQVKIRGARIELGEIEAALLSHPAIQAAVVSVVETTPVVLTDSAELSHCTRCGIASNYPGITFNDAGVCHICQEFESYHEAAEAYFKTMDDFKALAARIKANRRGAYDCLVLLSGGKDSTYMLYQVVEHGLTPLVFTLDNGYISDDAKANIRRVTDSLGVDVVFGETPHMPAIFADSLSRFSNVCNGCFKTIYTLATTLAVEKEIDFIVTGLSRGQFFETRLTPDLFRRGAFQTEEIDRSVLEARRVYHQTADAATRLLDTHIFDDPTLFDRIEYVDFYRYCDVDLDDLYAYLDAQAPWIRPKDTGRSTNCLINDVGIWVHQHERGFHNYALPYSWDVRMGHKQRDEALEELDDHIDDAFVQQVLREINYTPRQTQHVEKRLVAYYVADDTLTLSDLKAHLAQSLPDYMLPTHYVPLDALPLTANGKVDRRALPAPDARRPDLEATYVAPRNEVEEVVAAIWSEALGLSDVGVYDNFFELGGNSLPAIQVVAGVRQQFDVDVPLRDFFQAPTVAALAETIEAIVLAELAELSDEEAAALLADLE